MERRCRAAIDAFEGLQIRNALGLLASANAAAIARAAASNVGASVFRFSSPPLPQPPTTLPNEDGIDEDGHDSVAADASRQRQYYRRRWCVVENCLLCGLPIASKTNSNFYKLLYLQIDFAVDWLLIRRIDFTVDCILIRPLIRFGRVDSRVGLLVDC